MKKFITFALIALTGCSVVGPNERGVRLKFGKATDVLEPGAYFWIPVMFGTKTIDVSIQNSEVETTAASRDLQEVTTQVSVNWRIKPEEVSNVYKNIGDEDVVLDRVLRPAVNEVFKAGTAQHTAEEITQRRIELKQQIDVALQDRMIKYGIEVTAVNIVNLQFSKQFTHAVEAKQIAEQESKQAVYIAQKAKNDAVAAENEAIGKAKAMLAIAEAEAKANALKQKTLTRELIEYERVQKWNGVMPQVVTGGQGGILLNLDTNKK